MKSLLISGTYFPPQVGGISRIMERLAQEMGPDRVCCLTGTGPDPDPLPDRRGARVYRSPLVFSNSSRLKRAPAWAKVFGSIITQERPQATLLGTVDDGIPGRWLHRWFRLPYLVFAHGNEIVPAATQEGSRPAFLRTIACILLHDYRRCSARTRYPLSGLYP